MSRRAILLGPVASVASVRAQLKALGSNRNDLIVGVDGGTLLWRKLGIRPHFAIGDWDSLKDRKLLKDLTHLTLPKGKDRSDLHFALQTISESGVSEVICLGVTGGRPDQHLAMLMDVMEAASDRSLGFDAVSAAGEDASYHFLGRKDQVLELKIAVGRLVSVFAFSQQPALVSLKGFEYELKRGKLQASSHGLSNLSRSKKPRIELHAGKLLVVVPEVKARSRRKS